MLDFFSRILLRLRRVDYSPSSHYVVDLGGQRVFCISDAVSELDALHTALSLFFSVPGRQLEMPSKELPWLIYSGGVALMTIQKPEEASLFTQDYIKPNFSVLKS